VALREVRECLESRGSMLARAQAAGVARETGPVLDWSQLSDAALAELTQLAECAVKDEQWLARTSTEEKMKAKASRPLP